MIQPTVDNFLALEPGLGDVHRHGGHNGHLQERLS